MCGSVNASCVGPSLAICKCHIIASPSNTLSESQMLQLNEFMNIQCWYSGIANKSTKLADRQQEEKDFYFFEV